MRCNVRKHFQTRHWVRERLKKRLFIHILWIRGGGPADVSDLLKIQNAKLKLVTGFPVQPSLLSIIKALNPYPPT